MAQACLLGNPDLAEQMLKWGADPNFLVERPSPPIKENLLPYVINRAKKSSSHYKVARILLRYHANPNSRDRGGSTALYAATSNNFMEFAQILLDRGASTKRTGNPRYESSPLWASCGNGNVDMTRLLLKYGDDVNETTS